MGFKLIFTINRETFRIEIKDKQVFYNDKNFKNRLVRLIPRDDTINKMILTSRNKIPSQVIEFFNLTKKEEEEYNNAKDDKELMEICIKDCKSKGALLQKKEYED